MRAIKLLLFAVAGASILFVAGFALFAASVSSFASNRGEEADAIVILTGGEGRLRHGLDFFSEGLARRLLISGVNRSTTREDLQRNSEIAPVLFACCVDIGYEALDTVGNADEARNWVRTWGFNRVAIVTSSYHMPRSYIEFATAMPDIEFVARTVVRDDRALFDIWARPGVARLMLLEYVKTLPALARWTLVRMKIITPGSQARTTVVPSAKPATPKIAGTGSG